MRLTPDQLPKDTTEVLMAQVKRAQLGQLTPQPGQKVFMLDITKPEPTIELAPVKCDVGVDGKPIRQLDIRRGVLYCCAINATNADKHFRRMLGLKPRKK